MDTTSSAAGQAGFGPTEARTVWASNDSHCTPSGHQHADAKDGDIPAKQYLVVGLENITTYSIEWLVVPRTEYTKAAEPRSSLLPDPRRTAFLIAAQIMLPSVEISSGQLGVWAVQAGGFAG